MNLFDTLKQALEAMEHSQTVVLNECGIGYIDIRAIENLRTAIAELEKAEPEWYYGVDANMRKRFYHRCEVRPTEFNIPLYLHPADDEKLREDAMRYRWLRIQTRPDDFYSNKMFWDVSFQQHGLGHIVRGEQLDAAIDAARAAEGEKL